MTRKISKCIYGGGKLCERQGGTGDVYHAAEYTHRYPTLEEIGDPVGDPVYPPVRKGMETLCRLAELEDFFDDDVSRAALGIHFVDVVNTVDLVRKSLYDFDVDSSEGVTKLLELLPIMDKEILQEIAGEIWPGYPTQDGNADLLRAEVKGYLMDYLDE
ncbi:MAG: hypothetical protein ACXABY_27580 [Candidatus Thorarchaeota archaeon]|jgi:hypothetical protein